MGVDSGECMEWMISYACEHRDAFKLILCCSEGTKYENMVHDMVDIEIEATHDFAEAIKDTGVPQYNIDPQLEHILISGLFSAVFELVIHDVPVSKAKKYVNELRKFYTAGWKEIMGF